MKYSAQYHVFPATFPAISRKIEFLCHTATVMIILFVKSYRAGAVNNIKLLWKLCTVKQFCTLMLSFYTQVHMYTVSKVNDFPRYNMKCSGENLILRGIFHVVSRFPLLFMLYRGNSESFSNRVYNKQMHQPICQLRAWCPFVKSYIYVCRYKKNSQ